MVIVVTDATQVSVSGAVLTINPTADLLEGKNYAVQIAAGAIESFAGILDDTIWNFTAAAAIPTTIAVGSSGPSTYGDSVTFTATVDPVPSGGTVQFLNNGSNLGAPVPVIGGQASVTTSMLGVAGPNEITAEYSGNYQFAGSTSGAITQEVNKAELTVTAQNVFRFQNTANPYPLPYEITGYQNGEDFASSGVSGVPILSTDADLESLVGPYDIICDVTTLPGMSANNYSFTPVNGILTVVDPASPIAINVNLDDTVRTGLVGPAGGLGAVWNTIAADSATNLSLASGPASTVGFTCSGTGGWGLGESADFDPTLWMLKQGFANFDANSPNTQQLVITGLDPAKTYDLYIASAILITTNQCSRGEWSTDNTTSTVGSQAVDNRGNENHTTWVRGNNYVLFEDVVPDGSGNITVNGFAITEQPTYDIRLSLNGFQLVEVQPATIKSFGTNVAGSSAVIGAPVAGVATIEWTVPYASGSTPELLAALAPTYTLSSGTCDQPNDGGTPPVPDFSAGPVPYTVEDTVNVVTNVYTVTVIELPPVIPPPVTDGLALFFDASQLAGNDGQPVSIWTDLVASKNATTDNASPTLTTNALNGRNVVTFNGSTQDLIVAAGDSPIGGKQQFTVAVVFRPHAVGAGDDAQWYNNSGLVDAEQGGYTQDWGLVWNGNSKVGAGIGDGDQTLYSAAQPLDTGHIAVYSWDGTNGGAVRLSVDGIMKTTATGQTAARNSYQILFGRENGTDNYFSGDIAEILVYTRALTIDEEILVGSSLADKYGLVAYVPYYDIETFGSNVAGSSAIITTTGPTTGTIAWTVPPWVDVTTLAPSYTVSPYASEDAAYPSGTTRDFSGPVTYAITSPDLIPQKTYTVTTEVGVYPPNDNFVDAIVLPGASGIRTGSGNAFATLETGEPNPGASNTVWFKWTCGATDSSLTVSTLGSTNGNGGEWDSILGIYTGPSVDALAPLLVPPQDAGASETATVAVTADTTYYIQVAGYLNEVAANILLTWSSGPILVGASGSGTLSFGALSNASQWSTLTWVGDSTTIFDAASMDAEVQNLAASAINGELPTSGATTPMGGTNSRARFNSGLKVTQTRPTTTKAVLLQATLQNTSGSAINDLTISYYFARLVTGIEEVPGHRVYYNMTGVATEWQPIEALCSATPGETLPGNLVTASVTLITPWAPDALMYVLWVDDNAAGTDDGYTIDNVSFAPSGAGGGYANWAALYADNGPANGDANNDGVANGIAYFMGMTGLATNPGLNPGGTVTWPVSSTFMGSYEVQTSTDLVTWTNVVDPKPTPSGGTLSYTLPAGAGKSFVRLLVTPAP